LVAGHLLGHGLRDRFEIARFRHFRVHSERSEESTEPPRRTARSAKAAPMIPRCARDKLNELSPNIHLLQTTPSPPPRRAASASAPPRPSLRRLPAAHALESR